MPKTTLMTQLSTHLQNELAFLLGELQYEYEHTYDYFAKNEIRKKMNPIMELLGIETMESRLKQLHQHFKSNYKPLDIDFMIKLNETTQKQFSKTPTKFNENNSNK